MSQVAMLGVANGMLMKMLLQLERSIDIVLGKSPEGLEHLAVVTRGIEVALRLTLQMSRFTQLRLLLKNVHGATARLRAEQTGHSNRLNLDSISVRRRRNPLISNARFDNNYVLPSSTTIPSSKGRTPIATRSDESPVFA